MAEIPLPAVSVVAVNAHAGHVELALGMRVHALVGELAVGEGLAGRRRVVVLAELLGAARMVLAALLGLGHLQDSRIHANGAH